MGQAPADETERFDATGYWDRRLAGEYSLRGTGHISYSRAYNRWLYRRKEDVLTEALPDPGAETAGEALDLGSGTGWCVQRLLARGWRVRGADLSDTAVEELRRRFASVEFSRLELGVEPIPHPGESFALVTAMDVLYHVTDDDAFAQALAEIGRVLQPHGTLIITDSLGAEPDAPAEHVRFRSLQQWRAAAAAAGLELELVIPLYRWLSREREAGFRRLPDRLRGALEYALDRARPTPPHMRLARLRQGRAS